MSEVPGSVFDDERGSEIEDYTDQVPRTPSAARSESDGPQPSGFGPGDVADIDDTDDDGAGAGATDPAPAADAEAEIDVADIAEIVAERDQLREMAVRLQADFENYRKRTAAQAAGDVDRATSRLAEALLPVLDAAEAAFIRHPDEVGPVLNLLLAELAKHGLETLDLDGEPFDPEIAEAVAHEPGGGGDVVVAEVMRSGYRWRGKTLRAAMVRTRD